MEQAVARLLEELAVDEEPTVELDVDSDDVEMR